jgi:4-amino-4-deoxy-L-arabinose transferase-like glycosyltransferase
MAASGRSFHDDVFIKTIRKRLCIEHTIQPYNRFLTAFLHILKMSFPKKYDFIIVALLCFLCFFFRLGSAGPFDFNEGLYTQIAREMYLRHDFVTPVKNGLIWYDKPPLAFWLDGISFRIFGITPFSARLPVAISASLLIFLIWYLGQRFISRRTGMIAAFFLALNPLFLGTARQMTMDIHQTFFVALAMAAFLFLWFDIDDHKLLQNEHTGRHRQLLRWFYNFVFWASCGLGFMAKSVPGLLPIPIAFLFVLFIEKWRVRPILQRIWQSMPIPGIILLLAITVPWHYLMFQEHGMEFYREYFLHHHLELLNGKDFSHAEPFWFYVPLMLIGFFPWSFFFPSALAAGSKLSDKGKNFHFFCFIWAVGTIVLFSLMKSKLISYLLPMYPAAAVITAYWMDRVLAKEKDKAYRPAATLLGVIGVALWGAGFSYLRHIAGTPAAVRLYQDAPEPLLVMALHMLGLLAVGLFIAGALSFRRKDLSFYAIVITMLAFTFYCFTIGLSVAEEFYNAPLQTLASAAGKKMEQGYPLAIMIARPVRPSVFFYLPAFVFQNYHTPVNGENGIIPETGDLQPVEQFLTEHRPSYILTDIKHAPMLFEAEPDLHIEKQNGRWLLIRANNIKHTTTHTPFTPNKLLEKAL